MTQPESKMATLEDFQRLEQMVSDLSSQFESKMTDVVKTWFESYGVMNQADLTDFVETKLAGYSTHAQTQQIVDAGTASLSHAFTEQLSPLIRSIDTLTQDIHKMLVLKADVESSKKDIDRLARRVDEQQDDISRLSPVVDDVKAIKTEIVGDGATQGINAKLHNQGMQLEAHTHTIALISPMQQQLTQIKAILDRQEFERQAERDRRAQRREKLIAFMSSPRGIVGIGTMFTFTMERFGHSDVAQQIRHWLGL